MIEFPLVVIDWADAAGDDGWCSLDSARGYSPPLIQSVGFLIENNNDYLVIVQGISDETDIEEKCFGKFTIPKGMVKKIAVLGTV
jgi:hypothetical protein